MNLISSQPISLNVAIFSPLPPVPPLVTVPAQTRQIAEVVVVRVVVDVVNRLCSPAT